jgi:hypothetical protein
MTTQLAQIQLKRKTLAGWTADNPILLAGEAGWESDTNKMKVGDGATPYLGRPYLGLTDIFAIISTLEAAGLASDEVKEFRVALGLPAETIAITLPQLTTLISGAAGADLIAFRAAMITKLATMTAAEGTTMLGAFGAATSAGRDAFFDAITDDVNAGEVVQKDVDGAAVGIAVEEAVQPSVTELIAGTVDTQPPDPETLRIARAFSNLAVVASIIEFNPNTMVNRRANITASFTLKFVSVSGGNLDQKLSGYIEITNSDGGAATITLSSGGVGYATVVRFAGTDALAIGSVLNDKCLVYWEAQANGVIMVSQVAFDT